MSKKTTQTRDLDSLIDKVIEDLKNKNEKGIPFTSADLKAMGDLRRSIADDVSDDKRVGTAWRWRSPSDTANQLNVSERWLRNWIKGTPACTPAVNHRFNSKGKPEVRPAEVYEHIKKHARRMPKGLTTPYGYQENEKLIEPDKIKSLGLPSDPEEMMRAFFERPELLEKISPEKIKSLCGMATQIRQIKNQDERSKSKLSPDDVVKMMRSFVQLFTAVIDESAASSAMELLRLIHIEFSLDLVDSNPIGRDILESFFRDKGNVVIGRLSGELADRVKGIEYLKELR